MRKAVNPERPLAVGISRRSGVLPVTHWITLCLTLFCASCAAPPTTVMGDLGEALSPHRWALTLPPLTDQMSMDKPTYRDLAKQLIEHQRGYAECVARLSYLGEVFGEPQE